MIIRQWRLRPGPEWDDAVDDADRLDGFFAQHLDIIRQLLGWDPWRYSHPFLSDRDTLRVYELADDLAGYTVVVFLEIFPQEKTVELKWIERQDH